MGIDNTPASASFHDYATLLAQLHREMTYGDPDGPESDKIRDKMDRPWYELTSEEQDVLRGLSGDLYSIEQDRDPVLTGEANNETLLAVNSILQLIETNSYTRALNEIRSRELLLPADFVAHERGVCWSELGNFDAAVEFFDEALRIQPDAPIHQTMKLAWALRGGEMEDADWLQNRVKQTVPLALSVSKKTNHSITLSYATLLLGIAGARIAENQEQRTEWYRAAIQAAEHAEQNAAPTIANDTQWRISLSNAMVWCAIAHDQLDEEKEAKDACARAIEIAPESKTALKLQADLNKSVPPITSEASSLSDIEIGSFGEVSLAMLVAA